MVLLALLAMAIGGLLALSLVLVGLVEAPWPILLVGLLAALYGLQRLLPEGQGLVSLVEMEPVARTQLPVGEDQSGAGDDVVEAEVLTYRGIRYQATKLQEAAPQQPETLVEGIYRGQPWQRRQSTSAEDPSSSSETVDITYRGCRVTKPKPEA